MAASAIAKGVSQLLARNVGARIPTHSIRTGIGGSMSGTSSQPLKLREFAQKQIEQLGPEDASKIIGEGEEGLPTLLYHSTKADEPFKKFKWSKQGEEAKEEIERGLYIQPGGIYGGTPDYNDFLATTLNKESPFIQQLHRKSRTLVGLGKVNKLFDFTNKKHVDSIVKPLEKKDLKFLEERFPIHEKKLKKDLKDFLEDIKPGGFYSKRDLALDKEFLKSREDFLRKQIKELNLDKEKKSIQDRWKRARDEIEVGGWKALENENIKNQMRKLGYDAFTTRESGTNIMLFNPDEQFVPLFDPLKKSTIGFSTGGGLSSLNEKV